MIRLNITESNYPVAENVSRIINEKGLKQVYVAEKAGCTAQELSDMVNGRRLMKVKDVINLRNVLNVSYDELYRKGG